MDEVRGLNEGERRGKDVTHSVVIVDPRMNRPQG